MNETANAAVEKYLANIADPARQADCRALTGLIRRETGFEPEMYGASIVGFGSYHYLYESGREGDAPLAAFSSRAAAITLYLADYDSRAAALARLGRHKTGKGCLYINRLKDIDADVLAEIVRDSVAARKAAQAARKED